MKLKELFEGIKTRGNFDGDTNITGLAYDSREVQTGDLFFALPGEKFNGACFSGEAIKKGAVAVVSEKEFNGLENLVIVDNARFTMAKVAARYYNYPDRELALVGVTGTNGKTTITHLLAHIFNTSGRKSAAIGTLGCLKQEGYFPLKHTTPESLDLYRLLRGLVEEEYKLVVLEVSSHGLAANRVACIHWRGALFTNLTRDHLDFHGDMEQYYLAKRRLFEYLGEESFGIVNIDDSYGRRLYEEFGRHFITVGLQNREADYNISDFHLGADFSRFEISMPDNKTVPLTTPLIGKFNLYNISLAVASADVLGLDSTSIVQGVKTFKGAAGRLEEIEIGQPFRVFIDYAHTPDALRNALETLRDITDGRLIIVFGCGGDRDKDKRPEMGALASEMADIVVVTSDNPRSEKPEAIIDDIINGIPEGSDYSAIESRREAIDFALSKAKPGDIILIAGKGHEDYQEIDGKRLHFSDREVVCELLTKKGFVFK